MNAKNVREHVDVFGSCGNKLGRVDKVEGDSLELTKDSAADGQHHYLPLSWVARVDQHVHLNKDCGQAKREWTAAPGGTAV